MQIKINIPDLLYWLFCLYGFLLPFELILEVWFGIDTIFKPFRVTNLLIIGVFAVQVARTGLNIRKDIREDVFLYGVFLYGLVISLITMMTSPFNLGYFINDLFQSGLYILAFFIFKSLDLDTRQMLRIFQAFMAGLIVNSVYMFYSFVVLKQYGRDSGFMDNPNYVSLGLVTLLSYFLLRLDWVRRFWLQLAYTAIIFFLVYVFIITGSRTGLILLILASVLIFAFVSFWKKLGLMLSVLALGILLTPRLSSYVELGGPLVLVNRVISKLDAEEEDVRFFIWRGIINAMEERGYAGMGIGQFKANFSHFFNEASHSLIVRIVDRGYFLSPHNDYLAILTDYGIVGLACYLIFLGLSFSKQFSLRRMSVSSSQSRFLLTFSFILLSFIIVFGMAAENFQNQLFWFLLMFATKTPSDLRAIT